MGHPGERLASLLAGPVPYLAERVAYGVFRRVQLVNAVLVPDLLQDLEHQGTFQRDGCKELGFFHLG